MAIHAPKTLKTAGKALWQRLLQAAEDADWEYDAGEIAVLADACALEDSITALEAAFEGQDTLVRGSHGGTVLNPIISELRYQRSAKAALLKQLKLPEEKAVPDTVKTRRARLAADARWKI